MWPLINWHLVEQLVRDKTQQFILIQQASDEEQHHAFSAVQQVSAVIRSEALMGEVYCRVVAKSPFPPIVTQMWWSTVAERQSGVLSPQLGQLLDATWPQIAQSILTEALRFRWATDQRVRRLRDVPFDTDLLCAKADDDTVTDLLTGLDLTAMERAVATLLAQGHQQSDIAQILKVTRGRVSQLKQALRLKLPEP